MEYLGYSRCDCGAITVTTDAGDYSCLSYRRKKYFPGLDLRRIPRFPDTYCCDHCVNRYGLDLCGCGSGNQFGHCDGGFEECKSRCRSLASTPRSMPAMPSGKEG